MIKKLVVGLLKMMVGRRDTQANLPEDEPPPEFRPERQDLVHPPDPRTPAPRMTKLFGLADDGTCQVMAVNPLNGSHCRCGDEGAVRFYLRPDQTDSEMRYIVSCRGHARLIIDNENPGKLKMEVL